MNPADEWSLDAFVRRTERVISRPIVTSGGLSNSWNVTFDRVNGLSMTTTGPEEEAFRSLLVDLRSFTMQKEPVFIPTVHNILWRALDDTALRDTLARVRVDWKQEQRGAIGFQVDSEEYRADDLFNLWINGYYFHDEQYKAEALEKLPPIMFSLSRTVMYQMAVGAVRAVTATGWIIEQARLRNAFT